MANDVRTRGDRVESWDDVDQMYVDGKLVRRWQVAQTAQLDQNNGKVGPKAIRLINIMCPLGKVFSRRFGTRNHGSCMISHMATLAINVASKPF